MYMKITSQILSIPPYISTTWNNISSLRTEESHIDYTLHITLKDGEIIEAPGLEKAAIDAIFAAHEKFLESQTPPSSFPSPLRRPMGFSLKMGLPGFEHLSSILQHSAQDSHIPDLPHDVLSKVAELSQILTPEEMSAIPTPEPHCNCPHCQITRAIVEGKKTTQEEETINLDEEVSDEDLRFKTWDIKETTKDLYLVTNPLDQEEHYNVFLGDPIGCTCGSKGCEHIKAVLSS
jgi:hypothetical protein